MNFDLLVSLLPFEIIHQTPSHKSFDIYSVLVYRLQCRIQVQLRINLNNFYSYDKSNIGLL